MLLLVAALAVVLLVVLFVVFASVKEIDDERRDTLRSRQVLQRQADGGEDEGGDEEVDQLR